MSYIRYHLESPRGEKECYIRATVKLHKNEYHRFYIPNERLPRPMWDRNKQRAKVTYSGYRSLNKVLSVIEDKINEERRLMWLEDRLSKIEMDHYVKTLFNPSRSDIWAAWEQIIYEKKVSSTSVNRNSLPEKYKNIRNKLRDFSPNLTFNDITMDFMYRWTVYLYETHELSQNTVHRYIKLLKTFLNETRRRGLHKLEDYKDYSIKTTEVLNPYLTVSEVQRFHQAVLSDKDDQLRKLLLIGCYSGQRISDWDQLKPDRRIELHSKPFYEIIQTKGKKRVLVPATPKLDEVVDSNPDLKVTQVFNRDIKPLSQRIGITSTFVKPYYKKGVPTRVVHKKHELVSSHIGRRSFACNNILAGIPHEVIMRAGGWKDYKSFKSYVQLSSHDGMEQFSDVY